MSEGLAIDGVSLSFGGVRAVSAVTLRPRLGAVTALLGPNGAGKTTLFNLISGFLRADEGEITYGGVRVTRLAPYRIARLGIGRFFQNVRLLQRMTGVENIQLAMQNAVDESALATLFARPGRGGRETRLRDAAHAHLAALGLDELADRPASDLSYGQQKLLALARLLALDAKLLLLDEPFAGLGPAALDRMLAIVRRATADGRTVLLIEHNLDVVRRAADRIAFMAQGRLLTEGEVEAVLADSRLAEEYLGVAK